MSDQRRLHVLFCAALASAGSWAVQLTDHGLLALGGGMDGGGFQGDRAEEENTKQVPLCLSQKWGLSQSRPLRTSPTMALARPTYPRPPPRQPPQCTHHIPLPRMAESLPISGSRPRLSIALEGAWPSVSFPGTTFKGTGLA